MTKRKKKMKKIFRYPLLVLFILVIGWGTIKIWNRNDKEETDNKVFAGDKYEEKFRAVGYEDQDIQVIQKYVSDKNKDYLLTEQVSISVATGIINETYYIDAYLEKYLNYYKDHASLEMDEVIRRVNTHLDVPFYTNTEKTDDTLGKFVILNKHYYSDENYKGENLVDVSAEYNLYGTAFKLSEECYEAFLKMYEDAKNAGYGFKINSAYRSYESQVKIYQGWVNQDGQELADTYSARAGYSEHQTGYAFDVRDSPFTNDDYAKTKSFTWVSKNAYKYGFIIRFPEDKEYITGYQYEPWHYRYVGLEAAKYIHEHAITFEEYYEYFIRFGNPRNLS